jgi:hypothetical protein
MKRSTQRNWRNLQLVEGKMFPIINGLRQMQRNPNKTKSFKDILYLNKLN